jgi:hypothetical protein
MPFMGGRSFLMQAMTKVAINSHVSHMLSVQLVIMCMPPHDPITHRHTFLVNVIQQGGKDVGGLVV